MFSIFHKSKKILDYIPTSYQDIHSHILFGIDDGAKNIADSELILKTFTEIGFEKAITTPHTSGYIWPNNAETIKDKHSEVCELLPELTKKVNLRYASEYLMDDTFLDKVYNKELLTYNENYVLVEFSYYNAPINYTHLFFEMQLNGYQPILAHPERYNYFHKHPEVFREIAKTGVKLQLNLLSMVGYYGNEVQKMADELLKLNVYDFTGSDIHHKQHCQAILNPIKLKNHKGLASIMDNNKIL